MPYDNSLSSEQHQATLERIGEWLLHENIILPELLQEKASHHLSPAQWGMIKNNPEHYWSIVLANGLSEQKYYIRFKDYVPAPPSLANKHYLEMEEVWFLVNKEIYRTNKMHDPSSEEEASMSFALSNRFRAFYTLEKHALGREVSYSWASAVIQKYHYIHAGRKIGRRELGER